MHARADDCLRKLSPLAFHSTFRRIVPLRCRSRKKCDERSGPQDCTLSPLAPCCAFPSTLLPRCCSHGQADETCLMQMCPPSPFASKCKFAPQYPPCCCGQDRFRGEVWSKSMGVRESSLLAPHSAFRSIPPPRRRSDRKDDKRYLVQYTRHL